MFVPLCGKTLDIGWLLSQGYLVVGVELSELAIQQLFSELGIEPHVESVGDLLHYSTEGLEVFVGDLFKLTEKVLGTVDAIYDRAALVALPDAMRRRYTSFLAKITHLAPQLLVTFEYDQTCMEGPPFSVSEVETRNHYEDLYKMTCILKQDIPGGLKGMCPAEKHVWVLGNENEGILPTFP